MHVGGRILFVSLVILLGHLGMNSVASQNPGGRKEGGLPLPGRSEGSVPALPGLLVGENECNRLQLSNTFIWNVLHSSLQILHFFSCSYGELPCKLAFLRRRGEKERLLLYVHALIFAVKESCYSSIYMSMKWKWKWLPRSAHNWAFILILGIRWDDSIEEMTL